MINPKDLYTYRIVKDLDHNHDNDKKGVFGKTIIEYEIRRHQDARNLRLRPAYLIKSRQRVIIPSEKNYIPGADPQRAYDNYPAIITQTTTIKPGETGNALLRTMFPKTLNSAVTTSKTGANTEGGGMSSEHSSGSSMSNINTYSVSTSYGASGYMPDFSSSKSNSHSTENSTHQSSSSSTSQSHEQSVSVGDSMSIKDWSSYGYVSEIVDPIPPQTGSDQSDDNRTQVTWVWGQSHPWDVIQYNQENADGNIILPNFVNERLIDNGVLLPPSELSVFGLDIIMQAEWLVEFPEKIETGDEVLGFDHTTYLYTASHRNDNGNVAATLQTKDEAKWASIANVPEEKLDLSLYALDPVTSKAAEHGAAIGFTAHHFTYAPTAPKAPFKIVSPNNNLQVTGTGFDGIMTTTFTSPVKMTAHFKILDRILDYGLHLMHWVGDDSVGCYLNCVINGKWTRTMLVDEPEGKSGQNNISILELRNTDYTSVNFHDYLEPGLNTIEIEVVPVKEGTASYTLFAMAIGIG